MSTAHTLKKSRQKHATERAIAKVPTGETPLSTYLHVGDAHLGELGDAQHETDAVQNVALARPIQPRDGIELLVEGPRDGAPPVGLEAVEDDLLDVHRGLLVTSEKKTGK